MWRTPEELVAIGFVQARVVMMNEFHNGDLRCVWTRETGKLILPIAHQESFFMHKKYIVTASFSLNPKTNPIGHQ